MRIQPTILALASTASCSLLPRNPPTNSTTTPSVVAAQYDGTCFYPVPDATFNLNSYLGTWYQVAGTPFGPTAGARCVTANYSLNPNGTVRVVNSASAGPSTFSIQGTATPAAPAYGLAGVFTVTFPGTLPVGQASACPGPNYIVQDYAVDWAIVQTQEWNTLYVLSRVREPAEESIQAWVQRAVALGSNATEVVRFDQTGC
ncbi:hypothetical protein COCC4DRAFT_193659 [Bipolaris maydis ATCC 48331]|uniref:Lipocalin/cytosolic fatty-acid binding domain-containing protein n=2 Tax=Cochliobolus heterostrophus TaxID=5016 RepID=M2UEG9_COCH5|nr:uncharacterized protein COCC4DRAFT_193659 [Bipolaris maydis ATCC 48331]EMD86373.1 hypothetical protein COCHEDRAFT_1198301 [Bipolaris maydis C5]KAH7551799.1 hypothetical protein BM1_09433 [Bipolaris maydis]ENI06323.1 hypothetical protein COCC4DRAFT_193659 [Bipolaris maydis ATCC 48331]KAJ5029966.1 Calycin-like protein [Bipolaris maydis]KAJ5064970.1 Calycin-like protein [Bipolaris maydis]